MHPGMKTVLHDRSLRLGARMVAFAGYEMPLHYEPGIVREHLVTRSEAGLFDISHMGRLVLRGRDATAFLQHVLTGNAQALDVLESQYTMVPDEQGGVVDDAYLFRFVTDEYLLVVNAANRGKVLEHLATYRSMFPDLALDDRTENTAMLSLQGPRSREILASVLDSGALPEPVRNALSVVRIGKAEVGVSRSGYTGEPLGFELFVSSEQAGLLWDLLVSKGVQPVGLGARDTLRMEAGLPLYGSELGQDPDGGTIPALAPAVGRVAVSFSPLKGDFVGRRVLMRQFEALKRILNRDHSLLQDLPRRVQPVAVIGRGVARSGCRVLRGGREVGCVTSGTMVPYWKCRGEGIASRLSGQHGMRAIGLALIASDLDEGDLVEIDIRGRMTPARVVPYHLRSEAPPYARAIPCDRLRLVDARRAAGILAQEDGASSESGTGVPVYPEGLDPLTAGDGTTRVSVAAPASEDRPAGERAYRKKVETLVSRAAGNTDWRQRDCVNLIPSEQTPSVMTRLLSVLDPTGRYAEHKRVKALEDAEVFYYQGTGFIAEVEALLQEEMKRFLGCTQVEVRPVSGQMANAAVFSALVDYRNRADRKSEQARLRSVMNHHIIKGGHLSAQPMGALRDFVVRDPRREKPGVVNFPVRRDNPYRIDVEACREIIREHRPELVILGKSMTLHREPVAEIRALVNEHCPETVILYDMAHVLGLVGPHFQQPFLEGADLVTGSTHKTFFGTQRGVVAANWAEDHPRYELWEAVERRTFPGSVSNHHLGTMLGLLMAAYEMNGFKDAYQIQVLANARAFASALDACGLRVAGDPSVSFTETHQVILEVGYGRGPEVAERLEESHIIVNYQAAPDEEGFTASGCLRMGVAEMTRFGMKEDDFRTLAPWVHAVVAEGRSVRDEVMAFRQGFRDMRYCFSGPDFDRMLDRLRALL